MKQLMVLMLAVLVLTAGRAEAQDQYDVGIFADPSGAFITVSPTINLPFVIHAVAFGLDGEVRAFELSINGLSVTPSFIIGTEFAGTDPSNAGDPNGPNYIVNTGGCIEGGVSIALVSLTILPVGIYRLDTTICVGGTDPSAFDGAPDYTKCSDELVPFRPAPCAGGVYPDGCLIINASDWGPCPIELESFGAMKACF